MITAARPAPLEGTGATMLRMLTAATLVSLVFPLGVVVSTFRIVTVDVFLVPWLLVGGLALARGAPPARWTNFERALPFLIALLLASAVVSIRPRVSLDLWTVWLRASLFYFMVRRLLATRVLTLETLTRDLTIIWGVLLFVGAVQVLTGTQFGVISNYVGSGAEQWSTFGELRRVSGTTTESNEYAQWLVMLSLLVNTRLLFGRDSWRRLALVGLLVLVEMMVLLGTFSRANTGFFVITHAVLAVYWIIRAPAGAAMLKLTVVGVAATLMVAVGAALFLAGGALALLALRFSQQGLRAFQISHGLALLRHPKILLLGTGLGAFYPTLARYGIPITWREAWQFAGTRTSVHNGPLLLVTEGGVVAAALFLFFTAGAILAAFAVRRQPSASRNALGLALWLIVASYVIIPFQFYMTAVTYPTIFFVFLFYAMAFRLREEQSPAPERAAASVPA